MHFLIIIDCFFSTKNLCRVSTNYAIFITIIIRTIVIISLAVGEKMRDFVRKRKKCRQMRRDSIECLPVSKGGI